MVAKLGIEALQQCERVGGRAGEADEHFAVVQWADLAGVALEDDVAERHLPVAADGPLPFVPHCQDCRGSTSGHGRLVFVVTRFSGS